MTRHLHVHVRRGPEACDDFLCMSRGASEQDDVIVRRCLGIYALYRLHNSYRHGCHLPAEYEDAFNRFVREGMR